MSHAYLEVTYRKGQPLAAYYYLPRRPGDRSVRTEQRGHMVIDFAADDRPIGIELTAPQSVNLADLNRILQEAHQQPAAPEDLLPLARSA